jgi:nucleotide-binding universal stress UspA family protein
VFLNILVGFDGSPAARCALEHAVALARVGNAKLTVITVAPPVATYIALAGASSERMHAELEEWAASRLRTASELVPDDLPAHTIQRSGEVGPEIVKELERGAYDLMVLGTRRRGRAQESLIGGVNGYVHFHSRVPHLSVPDEGA